MLSYRDAGIEDYLRPSDLIGLDWSRCSINKLLNILGICNQ